MLSRMSLYSYIYCKFFSLFGELLSDRPEDPQTTKTHTSNSNSYWTFIALNIPY